MRALLRDALLLLPAALLVFLLGGDFFRAWDGIVLSVAPPGERDTSARRVRIVDGDRVLERWWPGDVVEALHLPTDPSPVPPVRLPEGRPAAHKGRFTFRTEVTPAEGASVVVPTTSTGLLALALGAWALLVALRNMVVGGAPWAVEPRAEPAEGEKPASRVAAPEAVPRRRNKDVTKPPPRPRRGVGRR